MATTTRSKHKQLVKEAENQRLVQEEENDTDSDYKTNLSESEQEASDQTISDNDVVDVINITDDDADTGIDINENILKKRKTEIFYMQAGANFQTERNFLSTVSKYQVSHELKMLYN